MAKSISAIQKRKRGRPITTGRGTLIGVRLLDDPLATLDAWIARQKEPDLTRPEAIRRLVELGLSVKMSAKQPSSLKAARAKELATKTIEKIIDPSTRPEERDERRRRLTKGPTEFREDRIDLPKAKRK